MGISFIYLNNYLKNIYKAKHVAQAFYGGGGGERSCLSMFLRVP